MNKNVVVNQPTIAKLAVHFEDLYKADDRDEQSKIHELQSSVSIPVLDDPISHQKMGSAVKQMKKGGYDYPLTIVHILYNRLPHVLLI